MSAKQQLIDLAPAMVLVSPALVEQANMASARVHQTLRRLNDKLNVQPNPYDLEQRKEALKETIELHEKIEKATR